MSYLGQNNNNFWLEENGNDNGNGNGFGVTIPPEPTAPPVTPWYQKAWGGVKQIIQTGTEAFTKVAPYIFDTEAGITQTITSPVTHVVTDPLTGSKTEVTYTPRAPGRPLPPGMQIITLPSGQTVTRTVQRAGIMPKWALPVALGIGGVLIMNMQKRR